MQVPNLAARLYPLREYMRARTRYMSELQELQKELGALAQRQNEHLKTVVCEETSKELQTKHKKKKGVH